MKWQIRYATEKPATNQLDSGGSGVNAEDTHLFVLLPIIPVNAAQENK